MSQQSDDLVFERRVSRIGLISYIVLAVILIATFV